MDKMVRITICIEPETERLLRLLARRHGRSISELVREAVETHWVKPAGVADPPPDAPGVAPEAPAVDAAAPEPEPEPAPQN